MPADPLIRKKVEQAMKLMAEQGVDCWIAQLGQETWSHPDPVQALVVGTSVTWPWAIPQNATTGRMTPATIFKCNRLTMAALLQPSSFILHP